jgi:LytS/YehU family sensor histidine kinase
MPAITLRCGLTLALAALSASARGQGPAGDDRETVSRIVLFSLLPLMVSFLYIFFIFFRKRREDESRRMLAESEMKALRAQMNPHFIFNSLNSIYLFIQQDRRNEAGDYLLKFSRLMRQVLEYTRQPAIPLRDDLDCLMLYMELEALRIPFTHTITLAPGTDADDLEVPPLLLQPFVENAIVHGFREKREPGHIGISLEADDRRLRCVITDNGVIPKEMPENPVKKKSLGSVLVSERIDALRLAGQGSVILSQRELRNESGEYQGMQVTIEIPLA